MQEDLKSLSASMKTMFVNNAVVVGDDGQFALDLSRKFVRDLEPLHLNMGIYLPPPSPHRHH